MSQIPSTGPVTQKFSIYTPLTRTFVVEVGTPVPVQIMNKRRGPRIWSQQIELPIIE